MDSAVEKELTCRLFVDSDLPGAQRLWEHGAGWGYLSEQQWKEWYRDTPHGDALIVVAVDTRGELTGQVVFTPAIVRIESRDVKAYRISAPILDDSIRSMSALADNHPLLCMFRLAFREAHARGAGVVFATPWEKWIPVIQAWISRKEELPPTAAAVFPCVGLPREAWSAGAASLSSGLVANRIDRFTPAHAQLWEQFASSGPFKCSVVQTSRGLQFKNGADLSIEVRNESDSTLVGFVSIKKTTGQLTQVVAHEPDQLLPVVAAAAGLLAAAPEREVGFKALVAMECSAVRKLRGFPGAVDIDFKYGFLSIILEPGTSDVAVQPDQWMLTPGD